MKKEEEKPNTETQDKKIKKPKKSHSTSTASSTATSINNSSKEELQAKPEVLETKKELEVLETEIIESQLSTKNTPVQKSEYGNQEINSVLRITKLTLGLEDFEENQKLQRCYGKHFLTLGNRIGNKEFTRRLKGLVESWKSSQLTSIKKLYNLMKSYPNKDSPLTQNQKPQSEIRKV